VVLDPAPPRARPERIWTYVTDDKHPYTVYDYTPNPARAGDGPVNFMKEFNGYLTS